MLSREKRLVKSRDFDRVYQRGKRVVGRSFNVNFMANRTPLTRVGIVVGKKFSKKATERNRTKRIFREATREEYDKIKPGLDVIIFVKNTDGSVGKEKARKDLHEVLKKEGLIK